MRTRAQIGKLLYDNLSNATWIRLREAFLGQELIAVGTEIIYKYEIRSHASPWNPDTPGVQPPTRSDYNSSVTTYLGNHGWVVTPEPSDVTIAVIDWATEVLYQSYLVVKKNWDDKTVKDASYVGLIEDSLKLTNPVPVSRCKPATLTVLLPVGNETYPPYSVSISCGAAQFWNVKTYRSGEQAILYQGIPYYYGVDVSGLSEATYYDSTLQYVEKGTSTDRYVKLSSTALPESVQVYAVSDTYHLYNPSHPSFPAFRVITSRDGSIETHFSDGNWDAQSGDVNFVPGAEDWCIRFLDLTDTEFDTNTATIPEGYTLLSSEQANFTDIDYARRYFYKWQYMFDGLPGTNEFDNISYFLRCIPNIQDLNPNIVTNGGVIYIKPVENSENLIFDEVESFLNTYYSKPSGSTINELRTFCGYPRDFTVQIEILNKSKFSTELRARIAEYIDRYYLYNELEFSKEIDSGELKSDICSTFGFDGSEFNISLIVSQGVYTSVVNFIQPFKLNSAQMERDGTVTVYSDLNDLMQLGLIKTGASLDAPSVSLASCWGWKPNTSDNAHYSLKSREYSFNQATPAHQGASYWDAFGLKAVEDANSGTTTLRIMSTEQNMFLNPGSQLWWANPFITETDATKRDIYKIGLNGNPFTDADTADANGFYSIVSTTDPQTSAVSYSINYYDDNDPYVISGTPSFPLPSKPTYTSMYNGDVYVSCESAQIAIIKNLDNYMRTRPGAQEPGNWSVTSGLFVYGIYDSESKVLEPCDQLEWSFNQLSPSPWTQLSSIRSFDFYACVGSDGGMSILMLDAKDPGTAIPQGISESGPYAIARFNSYSDARKKQINSKWHFYTADRFKITAKGLQTINMREISTMPTFASCNEAADGSWVTLRYGFWKFSGRALANGLGVTTAYQTYVGYDGHAVYSLLNTAYYDLINNISSYSESASYSANPGDRGLIAAYQATKVGIASYSSGTVTLNGGSYAHNTISVVSENGGSAETSNATPDCYIELSDEIVKWI